MEAERIGGSPPAGGRNARNVSVIAVFRKKWAYAVSCTGLVFTTIYNFGLTNGAEVMGTGGVIFSGLIWIVALFLLWYAWTQAKRGVLN